MPNPPKKSTPLASKIIAQFKCGPFNIAMAVIADPDSKARLRMVRHVTIVKGGEKTRELKKSKCVFKNPRHLSSFSRREYLKKQKQTNPHKRRHPTFRRKNAKIRANSGAKCAAKFIHPKISPNSSFESMTVEEKRESRVHSRNPAEWPAAPREKLVGGFYSARLYYGEMNGMLDVMQPKSDASLLREYGLAGSEAAFRELVARHSNLVYSAARRQVADPDLARDIAQSVFIDLARKARKNSVVCAGEAGLAPWLFRSTRYAVLRLLRDDRRRKSREEQAMETLAGTNEDPDVWERVRPLLDEAMFELGEQDRRALLLRYFENRDLRSVGRALGVSGNAAQKRLVRALEKLRECLARRGAETSAAALSIALCGNAVQAAPAGFAAGAANAGLAASAAFTGLNTLLCKIIAMTKIQTGAVCVALVAAPLVWQWRAQAEIGKRIAGARDDLRTAQGALASLNNESDQTQAALTRAGRDAVEARWRADEVDRKRTTSGAQVGYHWGDGQPLARVSKGLLHEIPFRPVKIKTGDLAPEARELLQLTGPEADQTSAAIARFLASVREAEASKLSPAAPTAAELAGRPADQVRVFAVGDITPQFVEARTQLLDSLQNIMGDDRFSLFQQGLGDWIGMTQPGVLNPSMAVYPDAKRVVVGAPGTTVPGAAPPSFGWSVEVLSTPGANGLNWTMDADDVPEPYRSRLADWITQAKSSIPAAPPTP